MKTTTCFFVCWALAAARPARSQTSPPGPDLKHASLEDLMHMEVTSVSKKEEALSEAPSAIFVITPDDISRSGVTTIPELLRMVPGLEVAHVDANKWAVSARGFNGRFADKMLVLVDGRSVYTPLFSGVYWDVLDTMLADIDRIEVIRGPGATLWGSNAVNGVINIITKASRDTRGALASLTSASDEHVNGGFRYGTPISANADVRVFAKYADRQPFATAAGRPASDGWHQLRGGFRLDWKQTPDDVMTVEGELYDGLEGQTNGPGSLLPFFTTVSTSQIDLSGGHVLGRWARAVSPRSDLALQVTYDRTDRREHLLAERRDTVDVDFHHHARIWPRQDLVWGAGLRTTTDHIHNGDLVRFAMPHRTDRLVNLFGQDEITLIPGHLRLTGGVKLEDNDYTGWEWQPDARLTLLLSRRSTAWASMSRAVRIPSRAEEDVEITASPIPGPHGLPLVTSLFGASSFRPETVHAHEVGYRLQPMASVSLDVASFYNVYRHLRTFEPAQPEIGMTAAGPGIIVPVMFGNGMEGTTVGVELSARWSPIASWRVDSSYTYLNVDLRHAPGSRDTIGILIEDNSPTHRTRFHSGWTVARRLDIDASSTFVGALRRSQVPGYTEIDACLAWHPAPAATVAFGGRNLLDARHLEFLSTLGELPTEVRRSVYLTFGWRF